MWKEVPRTRKKEVLSSHHVESSHPSLTTVRLEVRLRLVPNICLFKLNMLINSYTSCYLLQEILIKQL